MPAAKNDESLIRDLLKAFVVAAQREVPREMAALMCADEAASFLDGVLDPDRDDPVELAEEPIVEVVAVQVFGDVALARFAREDDDVCTLYFRRENGRWAVCADAEDDMSLEQLEDNASTVRHALHRRPIGTLSAEEHRILLERHEGLHVLLPRVLVRLTWEPLLRGESFPGDVLVAALKVDPAHWGDDPEALAGMESVVRAVHRLGDLTEHGAPHDEIWGCVTEFLAQQNLPLSELVEPAHVPSLEIRRAIVVPAPTELD
ncbi:contact-dependent growth inhibition system immunity protein [Allokutzneria sp. NRRL B-24872]|uniref:contact-dependent growth inhibition system immunity protein n=1 Tax=Allokutzneria sp. NRRL B-24872 TaxID=1137961 RepID=UPI000A3ACA92|nr:contact-dependent growth inhibition system immunity protein [Allokutzneria sp. NRRL B-24872]